LLDENADPLRCLLAYHHRAPIEEKVGNTLRVFNPLAALVGGTCGVWMRFEASWI